MSSFISWIEVDKDRKVHYFYLTDKDVFSQRGRHLSLDRRGNAILGQDAIREYYDIGLLRAFDHAELHFWNALLPTEIAFLVETPKKFEQNFGWMFSSGCFTNDNLSEIACWAPAPWCQMAFMQLLAQQPTADDLCYVTCFANDCSQAQAAERLFAQVLTNEQLNTIAKFAGEPWNARARTLMKK